MLPAMKTVVPERRSTPFMRRGASWVAQKSQPTMITTEPGSTYGPAAKIASASGGKTAAPWPIDGIAMTMPPSTAARSPSAPAIVAPT